MTFEVIAREFGVLSTTDTKSVPTDAQDVSVVVLHAAGPPLLRLVQFGEIPGGNAIHRGLRCPCGSAKYKLFYDGVELGCARCTRRRSRRQSERTRRSWVREGGDLEDRVLRALRPGRRSSDVPPALQDLAQRLVDDDEQRWSTLKRRAEDAIIAATAPPISIADVLEEER